MDVATPSLRVVPLERDADMDRYGLFCVANRRHPGVVAKRAWLRERFAEGLRFILLLTPDDFLCPPTARPT